MIRAAKGEYLAGLIPKEPGWTIDRRVPVALIIAGVMQFGAACASVAVLYATVTSLNGRVSTIEASRAARHEVEAATMSALQVDIAKIFERLDAIMMFQRTGHPPRP